MTAPLIIHTPPEKRAGILGQIKACEAQIASVKRDLAHVSATIGLFAVPQRQRARYILSHGFVRKGEIADICVRHLRVDVEPTTRERAGRVMAQRDLAQRDPDISDTVPRKSGGFKAVQALCHARRRKLVRMIEKRMGMARG
jgi:hypothetical protein